MLYVCTTFCCFHLLVMVNNEAVNMGVHMTIKQWL